LIRNSASIRRFGGRQDVEELLIFTRGGLILWALSGGGGCGGKGSPVDALIRTCLLEERSAGGDGPGFTQDGKHALKWAFHNGLGLVFVAVYRRVLRLLYVDDLLAAVRAEFARLYLPTTASATCSGSSTSRPKREPRR
jgi:signal recognition particle receptor subunit alpha